jgi:hypothetical protein
VSNAKRALPAGDGKVGIGVVVKEVLIPELLLADKAGRSSAVIFFSRNLEA